MTEHDPSNLLAPLASTEVDLPDAQSVYWRARVQQVLENERRRRAEALRPLRTLYLLLGVSSAAAALVLIPFAPAIGALALPLTATAVALGGSLLSQTTSGRLG